ncbi:MAG: Rpn family recombination-promoting nuclease/putative transposase [Mangrovibacterium sp.]
MYYLDPKNDLTFKRVFGQEKGLVISLLNSLLPLSDEHQIESVEYISAELVPNIPGKKNSIVDVRCIDKTGRQFIVEMQIHWTSSFMQRMQYNSSKAYSGQLKKGESYDELRPVYALGLINDIYKPDSEQFYHRYIMMNPEDTADRVDGIELITVELPKFKPEGFSMKRMAVLWLRFLTEIKNNSQTIPEGLAESKEIREAISLIEKSKYSESELAHYEEFWDIISTEVTVKKDAQKKGWEEGRAEGRAEGREEGREEGRAEGEAIGLQKAKSEMARSLKADGQPIEMIMKYSGLSKEEIEEM